jgi:hypothetical protein
MAFLLLFNVKRLEDEKANYQKRKEIKGGIRNNYSSVQFSSRHSTNGAPERRKHETSLNVFAIVDGLAKMFSCASLGQQWL